MNASASHRLFRFADCPGVPGLAGALRGVVAVLLVMAAGGCEVAGWVAQGITGEPPAVDVPAEYDGLAGRTVAVLVNASADVQAEHPMARYEICKAVSDRLAGNIENITVREPRSVVEFQRNNIYWNTATYEELAERLEVDRLVLIELVDYRLHEPGNSSIWKGTVSANVGVAETDGPRPNDMAYSTSVTASYPPNKPLGVVDADQQTIRLGMIDQFGRVAAGKFYDHQEEPSQ